MRAAAAPLAPPLRPEPVVAAAASTRRARRAPPAIAGPLVVLLVVVLVVGGALLVAALPGGGDGRAGALATASPRPTRTPAPTARPTSAPLPTPRRTATPAPTAAPTPSPKPTARPAGAAADLCAPILGFACGLDAGTYDPAAFAPPIRIKLGDGWSAAVSEPDIIALQRETGIADDRQWRRIGLPVGQTGRRPRQGRRTGRGVHRDR